MRTERDVRENPVAGDVVVKGKLRRRVTRFYLNEVFYVPGEQREERSCWISTWEEWMRKAKVAHIAQPGGEA